MAKWAHSCDYLCPNWVPAAPTDWLIAAALYEIHTGLWQLASSLDGLGGTQSPGRSRGWKAAYRAVVSPALGLGGVWSGSMFPWWLDIGYLFGGGVRPHCVTPLRDRRQLQSFVGLMNTTEDSVTHSILTQLMLLRYFNWIHSSYTPTTHFSHWKWRLTLKSTLASNRTAQSPYMESEYRSITPPHPTSWEGVYKYKYE